MEYWKDTLEKLWDRDNAEVLLASHRGKFSSSVMENTSLAFLTAMGEGAHMMEMDIDITRDGGLVGHHDKTMDRLFRKPTKISDWTLEELKQLPLYNYVGEICEETIETFDEMIRPLKDKTVVVLDKCWDYWDPVYEQLKELDMVPQAIFKFYLEDEKAYRWAADHRDCSFIPMSRDVSAFGRLLELKNSTKVPALEILPRKPEDVIFRESSFSWLSEHVFKVWCNSLSLAKRLVYGAGFDDLKSLRYGGDLGWKELIDRGVTIIQTDWPYEVRKYIRTRKTI